MAEAKAYGAYDSSEFWGLILVGGTGDDDEVPTVETTYNGEVFEPLPDLPEANWDSCVVIIDQDRIFTCGGHYGPSETFIFQKSTNTWNR